MRDVALGQRATRRGPAPLAARRRDRSALALGALALLLLLFLVLPLAALFWRAAGLPGFLDSLAQPMVRDALRLTLLTSLATVLVALVAGTPLAWLLARYRFPGRRLIETLVDLPLVLPPVVAGVALLMTFGRRGLLGQQLSLLGIELPFTVVAVVMAQLFIAVPFYVRGARVGFGSVAVEIEEASAIDGASAWQTFRRVTLPLALPGISSGIVLCWARAVSEFGATLMFAGNIAGRTQTMPLAIMSAMETDLGAALALSILLVVLSGLTLILTRLVLPERLDR